ncbi:MAG TPA: TetR/AcrR family transcriptional regulator [Gemmatimonadaceae bacterium]|nr:TetR/AcrR family transcriptional regulator [Gemmatimonadaceae bacterium]
MTRPKLFDRDIALERAIEAFRACGFAGTSTDDLLRAMGISRQSMYDTFGDKRRLYLEALGRYNAESIAEAIRVLHRSRSPRAALEAMLVDWATRSAGEAHCLGVSSISEFGRTDDAIATLNDASGQVLMAAIETVAADAQASGEINRDLDPKVVARFVVSLLSGLKVSARAGASEADLRGVITLALRSLL